MLWKNTPSQTLKSREFEVLRQLHLIEKSDVFDGTGPARLLLRHIVEETIAGHQPKELTIALSVLGKAGDVDLKKDRSVSGHVGKIRKRLDAYYLSEGKTDSVVISIPRGAYVANFEFRARPLPSSRPQPSLLSTNKSIPAGIYATTVSPQFDAQVGIANYLLVPSFFGPWLYSDKNEHCYVTAFDRYVPQKPIRLDLPRPLRYELEEQITRVYREADWEARKGSLPPETLQLAASQGDWARLPNPIEKRHEWSVDPIAIAASKIFWTVSPYYPGRGYREVTETPIWDYRVIPCYVWFEVDHIACCPVTVYHRLAES